MGTTWKTKRGHGEWAANGKIGCTRNQESRGARTGKALQRNCHEFKSKWTPKNYIINMTTMHHNSRETPVGTTGGVQWAWQQNGQAKYSWWKNVELKGLSFLSLQIQATSSAANAGGTRHRVKGKEVERMKNDNRERNADAPKIWSGVTCDPKMRTDPVIRRISCKKPQSTTAENIRRP